MPCYRVDLTAEINKIPYHSSYWLCAERSFLPLKVEIRRQDGSLRSSHEVLDFEQLPTGAWLPKRVVRKDFRRDPDTGENYAAVERSHTLTSIELDPDVTDDTFSTLAKHLPVGTLVRDAISGMEYTIGEGALSTERIGRIVDQTVDTLKLSPGAQPALGGGPTGPTEAAVPLLHKQGVRLATLANEDRADTRPPGRRWIPILAGLALVGGALLLLRQQYHRRRVIS